MFVVTQGFPQVRIIGISVADGFGDVRNDQQQGKLCARTSHNSRVYFVTV